MSEKKDLAIAVHVDTLRGYRLGVPALLSLFDRLEIRATFFFSLGPDRSGRAIRRIFKPGFFSKMQRTKAVSTYGLKTLFYGTLLPAPLIVSSDPSIFREAIRKGQECAVHAWDHVTWQDRLEKLSRERISEELKRAFDLFQREAGFSPRACAAPGWQVTPTSLEVEDALGLDYLSDTRGRFPFLPRMGGKLFVTPQIPTTLPTMDEILGMPGVNEGNIDKWYLKQLSPGLNVITIHAEMEGIGQIEAARSLFMACLKQGIDLIPLSEVAGSLDPKRLPICDVEMRPIAGRAGRVATQKCSMEGMER